MQLYMSSFKLLVLSFSQNYSRPQFVWSDGPWQATTCPYPPVIKDGGCSWDPTFVPLVWNQPNGWKFQPEATCAVTALRNHLRCCECCLSHCTFNQDERHQKRKIVFVILFRLQWTPCRSSLSLQVMCSWMSSPMQLFRNWSSFEIVQPLVSRTSLLKRLSWQLNFHIPLCLHISRYLIHPAGAPSSSLSPQDWLFPLLMVEVHIKMHRTKFLNEVFSLLFVYNALSLKWKKKSAIFFWNIAFGFSVIWTRCWYIIVRVVVWSFKV